MHFVDRVRAQPALNDGQPDPEHDLEQRDVAGEEPGEPARVGQSRTAAEGRGGSTPPCAGDECGTGNHNRRHAGRGTCKGHNRRGRRRLPRRVRNDSHFRLRLRVR